MTVVIGRRVDKTQDTYEAIQCGRGYNQAKNSEIKPQSRCNRHPRSNMVLKVKLSKVIIMTVFIFFSYFLVFSKILLKILNLFQLYYIENIKERTFCLNLGKCVNHEIVSFIPLALHSLAQTL